MLSEAKVQTKIIKHLEGKGFYVVKNIATNKAGTPDIIACSPVGWFIAIEVKSVKGKLSKLQEVKLKQITDKDGIAFAVYGWEEYLDSYARYIDVGVGL